MKATNSINTSSISLAYSADCNTEIAWERIRLQLNSWKFRLLSASLVINVINILSIENFDNI